MGFTAAHMDGSTYWHADTSAEGLRSRCGGSGYLDCHCGGDLCVCGNFGEVECFGCPDCKGIDQDEEGAELAEPQYPQAPPHA